VSKASKKADDVEIEEPEHDYSPTSHEAFPGVAILSLAASVLISQSNQTQLAKPLPTSVTSSKTSR